MSSLGGTRRAAQIAVATIIVFLSSGRASGQTTCSVSGFVSDQTGAIISNAQVSLRSSDNSVTLKTTTNGTGTFGFANLACGRYTLQVSSAGFEIYQEAVTTQAEATASLNVTLKTGSATQTVEVSSSGEASGEARPAPVEPTWNAWEEATLPDQEPTFSPQRVLTPNTDYTLNIDLSALSYGIAAGLFSQTASADAQKLLKHAKGIVRLDIIVIPDSLAFDPQTDSERHAHMDIDVSKMHKLAAHPFVLKKDALESLRKQANPNFVFGRLRVHIRTGTKLGEAGIAVSIWKDGTPIDEFAVPTCIGQDESATCSTHEMAAYSLKGSVVGALSTTIPRPDAALQIIQQDSSNLVGLFICNACSDAGDQGFKTWPMADNVDGLTSYLSNTIVGEFNKAVDNEPATSDNDYIQSGESLYLELFKDRSTGGVVPAAKTFNDFVRDPVLSARLGGPTLFVRFLPARPQPLLLFPVGMMVIPGSGVPLAAKVQITLPLVNQIYSEPKGCINQWRLMVPDPNAEDSMSVAVNEGFKSWNLGFQNWTGHAVVYDGNKQMPTFEQWISSDESTKAPTAVLMISHQKSNKMFFDDDTETPWIDSDHILRGFGAPSLAILAACGTAGPDQAQFVQQFNLRGMATVIGTDYEVDARMTGLFISILLQNLNKHDADSAYTIENAVNDSMRTLSNTPQGVGQRVYGPRAFAFVLAGNSQLRACGPTSPIN